MRTLPGILKDPLVHFLLISAALFGLYARFGTADPRDADRTTIAVDKGALLSFMQYRASAFEPEYFEAQFAALSPQQLRELANAYVREEAMAREAETMGLGENDYVIRRRLVQKVQFLIDEAGVDGKAPDDAALRDHFARNKAAYRMPASLTFTHVFIDDEVVHAGDRQHIARQLKARLEARGAGFNDAPAYGDRFPYQQNYVGRDTGFIANQFGAAFARALEGQQPSGHWLGPIRSDYGWHLVLLSERKPATLPSFEQVRDRVANDYAAHRIARNREREIDDLVKHYRVRYVDLPAVAARAEPAR